MVAEMLNQQNVEPALEVRGAPFHSRSQAETHKAAVCADTRINMRLTLPPALLTVQPDDRFHISLLAKRLNYYT